MARIFDAITTEIVRAIEEGTEDYRMPWHVGAGAPMPRNATSGRAYRGINIVLLWAKAMAAGFSQGQWATYRQWAELGGQVRRGERGTTVLLWKPSLPQEEARADWEPGARSSFIARAFTVFNVDQVDGLARPELDAPAADLRQENAEIYFSRFADSIWIGSNHAFYDRASDTVSLPDFNRFVSGEAYYAVLAHELTRWTGAEHRLNRDLTGRFGDEAYAMEELVAELGAAFTVGHLGLNSSPRHDHAPYIASWLKVLNSDPRAIVTAASKAQAAAGYLIRFESAATIAPKFGGVA